MFGFMRRKIQYEIQAQKDGRWLVQAACLEEHDAIREAKRILGSGQTHAVRVLRCRLLSNGREVDGVIFEQKVDAPKDKPVGIRLPDGPVPLCTLAEDVYGPDARRTIGQLLRDYLAEVELTPGELLFVWSHLRRFMDKHGLLTAAVHRIAAIQAETSGAPPKQRLKEVQDLADAIGREARDFAALRRTLPEFAGRDLSAYASALGPRVPADRLDHVLLGQLCHWMADIRSIAGKADALIALAGQEEADRDLDPLLDGLIAETLEFSATIEELFGAQANLGDFIVLLARLLKGDADILAAQRDRPLGRLMARVQAGRAPLCRQVLEQRLVREMLADKPLDKLNPGAEGRLLEWVVAAVTLPGGLPLGGQAVARAIATRRLRLRRALLRAQGLDHIADRLKLEDMME